MVCHAVKQNQTEPAGGNSGNPRGQSPNCVTTPAGSFLEDVIMKKIPLVNNKGFALIDDEDFELVSKHRWYLQINGGRVSYAMTMTKVGGKETKLYMHRLVMNAKKGEQVDHRHNNGLDNQKANLRFSTQSQNLMNQRKTRGTSQYKGVFWFARTRKWRASIKKDHKNYHIGYFKDEIEAAKAYDAKARELFGKFAKTNF